MDRGREEKGRDKTLGQNNGALLALKKGNKGHDQRTWKNPKTRKAKKWFVPAKPPKEMEIC